MLEPEGLARLQVLHKLADLVPIIIFLISVLREWSTRVRTKRCHWRRLGHRSCHRFGHRLWHRRCRRRVGRRRRRRRRLGRGVRRGLGGCCRRFGSRRWLEDCGRVGCGSGRGSELGINELRAKALQNVMWNGYVDEPAQGARWKVLTRVRFAVRCAVCGVRCTACAVCGERDTMSGVLGLGGAIGWRRVMGEVRHDLLLRRARARLALGAVRRHPSGNPSKITQQPWTVVASLRKQKGLGVGLLFLRN